MGKKRTSDTARLITWAMGVTEAELVTMGETIMAIKAARFPVSKPPKPRAVRRDAGKSRTPPPSTNPNPNEDTQ